MIKTARYTTIMSSLLKECHNGNFSIRKKVIPKGTILDMYDSVTGRLYKDEYDADFPVVVLQENGNVWMSDTPYEQEGIKRPLKLAKGEILISGLGIGLFPVLASRKTKVRHIDIVEKNKEVIELVFNQIETPKMRIIQDDIYAFLKATTHKYNLIFIDIWADHFGPIKEIREIKQLASRCLEPEGIALCWLQELYDRIEAKLPREPTRMTGDIGIYEPCLICGKILRSDYANLCMDCADALEISELFIRR